MTHPSKPDSEKNWRQALDKLEDSTKSARENEARQQSIFDKGSAKIGGDEKTETEYSPNDNIARTVQLRVDVMCLQLQRKELVEEYERLIAAGVSPDDLLAIDGVDMDKLNNPAVFVKSTYAWDGNPLGKDSNPKDAIGSRKVGLSAIPRQVLYEVALAMLEGALKYARHNYRIAGVRASVYYDANSRHMDAWWEGQDLDPGSGLHHIVKAIASLIVLRDSIIAGNWTDDRPPSIGDPDWISHLNKEAERIIDAFAGEPKRPYVKGDNE